MIDILKPNNRNQFIIFSVQKMFGIEGVEIYFPKTYVDQKEYQIYKQVSPGKYTKGLGQLQLSFANASEDVNSISLTVVNNLMRNYNIHPSQVGRLQVGTQTLIDKSKSTKTVLMTLFKGNHDIEGATSINACYGATNALINTLNWISSPYWDGRYGIVVAADLAVYEDGPARPTGGAGAVALLIGPNGKITFSRQRASFIDHAYDFYKPVPHSQYPTVDGKLSIQCYLKAIKECYINLKKKCRNRNLIADADYFCLHSPFYKMVQKSFTALMKLEGSPTDQQIAKLFQQKVDPGMFISKRIGNIYTGSLYANLISLLVTNPQIRNKNVMMFSYGSGLCSSMFTVRIRQNPLKLNQISDIQDRLKNRIKIRPQQYTKIMLTRQINFGKFKGKIPLNQQLIEDNVFYLSEIDDKWRRKYEIKNPTSIDINKRPISSMVRLQNLNKAMQKTQQFKKFYKLSVNDRLQIIQGKLQKQVDRIVLQTGGLNSQLADTMIQNVIGTLSLPLSVVPQIVINNKKYIVPMCTEQPSVVAACSSIGKLISPYSFYTSSTANIMIGQVHLPKSRNFQAFKIMAEKQKMIDYLNEGCQNMVKRGGGVIDLRLRQIKNNPATQYSVDIIINVCEAMGANITNTLCERAKNYISRMGISTGIAILSNYCLERKALSYFQMPVKDMGWKGVQGQQVAEKILEAYNFAANDRFRAVTHNKGIMNGIDSVCVATGQDWRAIESAAHSFASKNGQYKPLTHYQIIQKNGEQIFRGILQLPVAVGTRGGAIQKNSIYKTTLDMLGNPSAQQLAEVMVTIGLAQNFAALRALAIEGINKGHMVLHARTLAQKSGVPKDMIEAACRYMEYRKRYDLETIKLFMETQRKAKL